MKISSNQIFINAQKTITMKNTKVPGYQSHPLGYHVCEYGVGLAQMVEGTIKSMKLHKPPWLVTVHLKSVSKWISGETV